VQGSDVLLADRGLGHRAEGSAVLDGHGTGLESQGTVLGATAGVALVALGVIKAGELGGKAIDWLQGHDTRCVTVSVYPGDSNIEVLETGIDAIGKGDPAYGRETQNAASNLGTIYPGDRVEVCHVEDNILGDFVTAEVTDRVA
jgi:hypothetical protein